MPTLASRLSTVQPSATLAIAQRAAELRAQGLDILGFSLGEPDFETPEHIRAAAAKALDKGSSHYTAVAGIPKLREAIARDSAKRRGIEHAPSEVVVGVGAKHVLFNLALALFDPGDEVLIPGPCWVSYPEQVRLVGATPVIVPTREADGFRMSPAALTAALTPRTKAIVLCSPSNPTGAAYDEASLRGLADVLRGHHAIIIVDEIYGHLTYDGFEHRSILSVAPDLKPRTIIVDGCSKTYAMTGWRIGWMIGPREVAAACDLVQSQSTTNPTAVAQHAAVAALEGPADFTATMRRSFEERRNVMLSELSSIPGLSARKPEGAFYLFVNVQGLVGKKSKAGPLTNDIDVAKFFLEEARCAAVPGTPFAGPGYVRFSYATSPEIIREGARRIRDAVATLT